MARRLSTVDWAFLQAETPTNLAHVAGLWVFRLPESHRKDFWREYIDGIVKPKTATPPFNYKLRDGLHLPSWIEDPEFDLDQHVRYLSVPKPGSTEQLLEMVSGIHSHALDRSRPLWECYLIDGLSERRVAIYFKVHHALLDGGSALGYMLRAFQNSSEDQARQAFWQPMGGKTRQPESARLLGRLGEVAAKIVSQAKTLPELSRIVASDGMVVLNLTESPAKAPFSAPKSPLGKSISSERCFAVKGFSFARIKELGKATGSTVNDMVLSMSAGALLDHFNETGELPKEPLTAWVPVSIRTGGEGEAGNRVAVIVCSLSTELADAVQRLEAIKASVRVAKDQLKGMSAQASDHYNMLLSGLVLLTQKLRLAERLAPVANVVISNVSGSRSPLYVNGAKLVEQYPMSMLIDGQALNITVTSHDERLDFGLLACPHAVPNVQRLADRLEDALGEIEEAVAKSGMKGVNR